MKLITINNRLLKIKDIGRLAAIGNEETNKVLYLTHFIPMKDGSIDIFDYYNDLGENFPILNPNASYTSYPFMYSSDGAPEGYNNKPALSCTHTPTLPLPKGIANAVVNNYDTYTEAFWARSYQSSNGCMAIGVRWSYRADLSQSRMAFYADALDGDAAFGSDQAHTLWHASDVTIGGENTYGLPKYRDAKWHYIMKVVDNGKEQPTARFYVDGVLKYIMINPITTSKKISPAWRRFIDFADLHVTNFTGNAAEYVIYSGDMSNGWLDDYESMTCNVPQVPVEVNG